MGNLLRNSHDMVGEKYNTYYTLKCGGAIISNGKVSIQK
jgi:hypothetical protein